MRNKVIILTLFTVIIFTVTFPAFAGSDVLSISLSDAMRRAKESSTAIEDINDSLEDIWDQRNEMLELKDQMQTALDGLERFEELYNKKYVDKEALTPQETGELTVYQNIYGDKPPEYSNQELLDKYIKNRDFPHYQLWTSYYQLKNQRDLTPIQLEMSVKELYSNVLSLDETLKTQLQYLENLKSQYESAKEKNTLGTISEYNLLKAKNDYLTQELMVKEIERNKTILEFSFKQLIDVPLEQDIVLSSNMANFQQIDLEGLDFYEEQALNNRMEVLNAKAEYEMEKREADIIKEYLSNPLTSDRLQYDADAIDAKNALEEAKIAVKTDVTTAYFDTLEAKDNYLIELDNYKSGVNDLKDKRQLYNLGMLDKNSFEMVEFSFTMTKNTLISSRRNYELKYSKLVNASGLGPSVQGSFGGAQ